MFSLVIGTVVWATLPQHRAATLAAGTAWTLVKGVRNHIRARKAEDGASSVVDEVSTGVALEWQDVRMTLLDKKGRAKKHILRGVNGKASPGRLLAIMGPSGSGKTSLLNALAGQTQKAKRVKLVGCLLVNGKESASLKEHKVAYVRQDDIFYSQLTVRETLRMAAQLQLPQSQPDEEKDAYVEELILHLGLVACADTIVGDDRRVRGISGGERKRLSIACELISSPSIIFADEPTTGLDSFQAEKVVRTLQKLARDGHTVVCSIHQPRGSIFQMFDDLVLLADGQLVYQGAAEGALPFFEEQGHKCPERYNPAEFYADLIAYDFSTPDLEAASRQRVTQLQQAFVNWHTKHSDSTAGAAAEDGKEGTEKPLIKRAKQAVGKQGSGWRTQFRLLLERSWRQVTRDKTTNVVRGAMNVTSALIFGSIFWRLGLKQSTIQDRMGLLQVAAVNTAMASLTKTINAFPRERDIVNRERAKGQYGVSPYFVSKLVAELPIAALFPLGFGCLLYPMAGLHAGAARFAQFLGLVTLESFTSSALGLALGSLSPTTEAALALGPSVMVLFIVFGGYYINPDNAPRAFRWIPRVSLIKWAFEGLSVNEFRGLTFDAAEPGDQATGEGVLKRLGFGDSSIHGAAYQQARLLGFFYLLTFSILKDKEPKFLTMEAPPPRLEELDADSVRA